MARKQKGVKEEVPIKYIFIIISIIFVLILIIGVFLFWNFEKKEEVSTCGDGTFYNACSLKKPYFCSEGILIEKASLCGCSDLLTKEGDLCVSGYQTNPKEVNLDYILRGEENSINFVAYEGLADYLADLPRSISYRGEEEPSKTDFKLRNINEEEQRELLLPLVVKIQNLTEDKTDQLRIAVSLVQNIPFGFSEKNTTVRGTVLNYSRYPYEVLYDEEGVCGEKSELLAFLLRELGYEVALFYHSSENHESIGVGCSSKYGLDNTGYCFIETTGPAIITDSSIEYVGGIKLLSEPEVFPLSTGASLEGGLYEYRDAKIMKKLREGSIVLFKESRLEKLKQKYGLIEEYNPQ
jgi:hypothetical protein